MSSLLARLGGRTLIRTRLSRTPKGLRLPLWSCTLFVALVALLGMPGGVSLTVAAPSSAPAIPLKPYVYAAANSVTGYDIMLSDGVNKDRRVARVKVDSVYFGDVTAKLSANATHAVFRVTGDRLGGSSLYDVDLQTGKYAQIATSKNASEGIGAYSWSPAGNTLAFVRSAPALDPALMDDAYGTVYIFSAGFQAVRLKSSNGSDRVLGFAPDGLGVYAARREIVGVGTSTVTLEHLVYLPLEGDQATVLIRSSAGLKYTHHTLLAPSGGQPVFAFVAEGDFAYAAANSNVKQVMPGMAGLVAPASRAKGSGKLSRPASLGLVVSDPLGLTQVLLRRDAEDYTHLSWAPDGSALLAGGARSGGAWRVDMEGGRMALGASLLGLRQTGASVNGTVVVLSDNPATRLVSLDYKTGKVAATKYVGAAVKPGAAAVKLSVPYIHQVNDTQGLADGNWACGPTSVAMALAYYGKIEPWPDNVARARLSVPAKSPTPNGTSVAVANLVAPKAAPPTGFDFAPYVTSAYTYNGHTYDATSRDPRGNPVAGLYGTICPTGLASWQAMTTVLQWHGLNSQYVAATWDGIVAALKRGHPVMLGNQLTSEGHILLVVGYTNDGNLIVNDPYGNRFTAGYGTNDGQGVLYPWKRVTARRALEVVGVWPPPSPTPVPTFTPKATSTATATATATATETVIAAPTNTAVVALAPTEVPSQSPVVTP